MLLWLGARMERAPVHLQLSSLSLSCGLAWEGRRHFVLLFQFPIISSLPLSPLILPPHIPVISMVLYLFYFSFYFAFHTRFILGLC